MAKYKISRKAVMREIVGGPKVVMPCKKLKYCPYGPVVEQYPLLAKRNKHSCPVYGHQCPVYYSAEKI